MIPILYENTETAFENMGIGALSETISARVKQELNGKNEMELTYPETGIRFSELQNDRIILAVPEFGKDAQPYRIYQITKPINGIVSVYARHISDLRTFIPVSPFSASSLADTLIQLPLHLEETSPFTFYTDKTVASPFQLSQPASLGNVLGGMAGSILDTYGGEYEFDKYQVKLLTHRGSNNGVTLRYGKNITDLTQEESIDSTITGILPFYKNTETGELVTLTEKILYSANADNFPYKRTVVKDFSDRFQEGTPSEEELRSVAQRYISQSGIGVPDVNLKVSFVNLADFEQFQEYALLERVNLGDTVRVIFEKLGVSARARIVNTVFDCIREKYINVTIGSVKSDLARTLKELSDGNAEAIANIRNSIPSAVAGAVSAVTDSITGVNGGHYILNMDANGNPYEILIMDTDDIATAVNVLRINMNGIGFSQTGYNGPFTTAWTIDGQFVADFITAGILNASLIKAGVLSDLNGSFYLDLTTGEFRSAVTDATNTNLTNLSEQIYASFVFGADGLTIKGTTGATQGAYVKIAADKQEFHVQDGSNDITALELSSTGINTPALVATGDVSATTFTIDPWMWYVDENGLLTLGRKS